MSENLQVSRENEELRGMVGELQKKLEEKEKKEKKEKEQEHNHDNNHETEAVKDGAADVNVDLVNVAHIDTKVMDELRSQLSTETARRVACETTMGELMRTVKMMEDEKAITAQAAQQQAQEQVRKKALHSERNPQQPSGNDKSDTEAAARSLAEAEARTLEMQQLLSNHQQQVASINTTHSLQLSEMQEANVLRVAEMMAQVLTQRTA